MPEHIPAPAGLPPVRGYSHVVTGTGTLIAVSGQLPLDAAGDLVGGGDALGQARQVFANLRAALRAADAGMEHVLRLTVFLTDLAHLDAYRAARDEAIGGGPAPASSLVQVAALVHPGAFIEIDALAVR